MSTKSGRAPACEIASVVAMKVFGTVTTVSPGLIPAAMQSESKRIGTVGDAYAVFRIAECREITFKLLHHGTADEARGS